jgi:hypothetical protein
VSSISYDEYRRRQFAHYPEFRSDEDIFGSWLSSLTGIHINPLKGQFSIDPGQLLKTAAIAAGVVFAGPVLLTAVKAVTPAIASVITAGGKAAEAALGALGAVKAVTPAPQPYTTTPINSASYVATPVLPAPLPAPLPVSTANLLPIGAPAAGLGGMSPAVLAGGALLLFVLWDQSRNRS